LDLVLLTGDLTQSGTAEQFKRLDEFLEQLWHHFNKELGCNPKLLAVPGNHDLVRPTKDDDKIILEQMRKWNHDESIREQFWNDPDSWYHLLLKKAFKNYLDWWEQQSYKLDNCQTGLLPGDFSACFEKTLLGETLKLGIVGLNTAFLQLTGDDYEGKLALHTKQFYACCQQSDWIKQHNAYLVMTHHPAFWLNKESQQHLSQHILADNHCVVHLCGHLHKTANYEVIKGSKTERTWQGRSLFIVDGFGKDNEQRSHGYSVFQLKILKNKDKLNNGELKFYPREYRGGQFVQDFDAPLASKEEITRPKRIQFFYKTITNSQNGNNLKKSNPGQLVQKFIFVNTPDQRRDNKLLQEIKNFLEHYNLWYIFPMPIDSNTKAEEIEQDTNNHLESCNAVILIYHQEVPVTWLRQQIALCYRAMSKRNQPHELIAVFDIPPTKDFGGIGLPHVHIFDCSKLKSPSCLLSFADKILS
ncbi:MAG: metallophosphoesterase, partial [Pseudomonadota bacterium]|nr:metallophosphoesterase [Pseudomonadota bacterium]